MHIQLPSYFVSIHIYSIIPSLVERRGKRRKWCKQNESLGSGLKVSSGWKSPEGKKKDKTTEQHPTSEERWRTTGLPWPSFSECTPWSVCWDPGAWQ